jgi:predicted RNase H-like HicB family nuclease
MNIKVIIEPGEDVISWLMSHCMKSCWSQGKTRDTLQNIHEAIDLFLEPER